MYTSAKTIYAVWGKTTSTESVSLPVATRNSVNISIEVKLDAQGGTTDPSSLIATKTTSYSFKGWSTTNDDSVEYVSAFIPSTNITLYAVWESATTTESISLPVPTRSSINTSITVTLDAQGGSVDPSSLTTLKVTSYSFKGWSTAIDDTVEYISAFTPTLNTTLYAVWETVISITPITLPSPKKSGYNFIGWTTSIGSSAYVSTNYKPETSVTLYAVWGAGGLVHIGSKSALVYIYHNGKWYHAIPNIYSNGSFKICT